MTNEKKSAIGDWALRGLLAFAAATMWLKADGAATRTEMANLGDQLDSVQTEVANTRIELSQRISRLEAQWESRK
jgi:hypothetical protein